MDKIKLRGETEANWILYDPILAERETVLTLDAQGVPTGIKAGDGVHKWSELNYLTGFSTAESDPLFQAWLADFVASAQVQSDYEQADNSKVDYIKNKPLTKQVAFTDSTDVPASHIGQALKILRERADETGLEFFTPTWISAITKAMVEAVLTGSITTHSHAQPDAFKLQFPWNTDFSTLYQEHTIVGGLVTQIDYWATSAKATKLFTKVITYTGDNATSIVLTDNVSGKVLTTAITYSGSDVQTITKTVS